MPASDAIEILEYDSIYRDDFKRLNLAWIEQYFAVEDQDRKALEQPEQYILERGGYIFFARYLNQIVGTCALIHENAETFELAKMAVTPEAQGKQIGRKLCAYAIEKARQTGAKRVYLESNRKLVPALELYKKVGFREVPMTPSPYARADIRMQLDL